ncbi:killer toxin resistant protein [Rhodotorula toruloides]
MWSTGLQSLVLAGLAASTVAHRSPPVAARVEAWPAPDLVTQFLETTALEAPNEFLHFLSFLSSNPHSHHFLRAGTLLPRSLRAANNLAKQGVNPIFAPEGTLQPNETYALLDAAAGRSLLFRSKGLRESLQTSLANREASVIIEGMRGLWEEREAVVPVRAGSDSQGEEACESWIDVAGARACSEDEFWDIVGREEKGGKKPIKLPSSTNSTRPRRYSFDHVSPHGDESHLPRFVFWANPTSPSFQRLFTFLHSLSAPKAVPVANPKSLTSPLTPAAHAAHHPPRLQFVLRWKPSSAAHRAQKKLVMSGYGAALDIKKSDYLAIDDRVTGQSSAGGNGADGEPSKEPVLEIEGDVPPKMEPVRKGDVAELAIRTAQFVLASDQPLQAFVDLTSAFPRLASHLPTLVPDPDPHLISEVSTNQMSSVLTTRPSFFLNGVPLTEAEVDPFALLRLMRKERKHIVDLLSLSIHMTGKEARDILIGGSPRSPSSSRDRVGVDALGELYDSTDRDEGGQVILWWNDLEKDRRYKSWSKSVRELLRPVYPGSMNLVARNLNNVVFVLDLTQPEAISLVVEHIKQFVGRGIPVRFGVVPIVGPSSEDNSLQTLMAQVTWYLTDALGRAPTMQFLATLLKASPESPISEDLLKRAYLQLAATASHVDGGPLARFNELRHYGIGKRAGGSHSRLTKTREYLKRLGVPLASTAEPKKSLGAFFMNGAYFAIDDDFTQNLQRTLGLHTQYLVQEVYLRSLTDDMDASSFFADLPATYKRRNPYIFPSPETNPLKIVNLVEALDGVHRGWIHSFYIEGTSGLTNQTTGLDIEDPPAVATIYVITDLNDPVGADLAVAALKLAEKTTQVRISFVHNPADPFAELHPWTLSRTLFALQKDHQLAEILPDELIEYIDLNLDKGGPAKGDGHDWPEDNPLRAILAEGVKDKMGGDADLFWDEVQWFRYKLGFKEGESGIVINGRVIGPWPAGSFGVADFNTLLAYEMEKRIKPVVAAIDSTAVLKENFDRLKRSHIYNVATSIVGAAHLPDPAAGIFGNGPIERRRDYVGLAADHSAIVGEREEGALFEVAAVIDPATELAQRWAPIVETLSQLNSTHVRLYLNPSLHVTEVPIKRFYQYSFNSILTFDDATGQEVQPAIRFEDIPEDVLLTFGIDAQQAWLAFPKHSVHDLDNIRLADLPAWSKASGVEAVFELESLLVEGHARDMPSSRPPRGLQLELRRGGHNASEQQQRVDTTVMANLGYLQFKASPGAWRLGIRSGRSSEVFDLESIGADGWKSGTVDKTGTTFVVSTLEGLTLYPRFTRKPGHETTELLDESADVVASARTAAGIFERVKSMIPFLAPKTTQDLVSTGKKAEINVFTVASGLLYERMALLMVVSVLRHTKSSVKFWFIQNFLSPSFKAFIPHMAREYGFHYELFTYKWPHWLRAQKEKQRTIWGYKILFLDVLFPLELDRVIFVDSDQIVRADLKELVDLNLHGAPYAFAPMGDDRAEMEGFRFWKTGYWKNHLKGNPYHISALYVVDLDRFRQIAAGDRLRQQYQALSADPHSLANLDQDLPNNMQGTIPIYTLGREWLWCETWCSDESLAQAKTIDLCNNPLTHEPKLQRAKRLIPEWLEYDAEVSAFAQRVAAGQGEGGETAASVFRDRADELEQAVQQAKEREEFVEEQQQARSGSGEGDSREQRVKDEL